MKYVRNIGKSKEKVSSYNGYMAGDIVRRLQHELNIQFGRGIVEDGLVGPLTLNALILVKKGARGNITKIIQELLMNKGYSVGPYGADGIFGNATFNGILKFQRDNGLSQDGIVGNNTWRALLKI